MLLAGPISHTSIQYMGFVEIFNVSLDLSTRYFAHFGGCWASFAYSCYSCYSILECYNLFSAVKLSISVLFYIFVHRLLDILLILVGVELLLCIVVIVATLS